MLTFAPAIEITKQLYDEAARFLKIIFEKVSKIFGYFKNSFYLCTTFRFEKSKCERLGEWFFDLLVFYIERKV